MRARWNEGVAPISAVKAAFPAVLAVFGLFWPEMAILRAPDGSREAMQGSLHAAENALHESEGRPFHALCCRPPTTYPAMTTLWNAPGGKRAGTSRDSVRLKTTFPWGAGHGLESPCDGLSAGIWNPALRRARSFRDWLIAPGGIVLNGSASPQPHAHRKRHSFRARRRPLPWL
jgi:hypothetical protein